MNQSICIWSHLYNCGLAYDSKDPPTVTLPKSKIEFHKPPVYLKVTRLVERQMVPPLTEARMHLLEHLTYIHRGINLFMW